MSTFSPMDFLKNIIAAFHKPTSSITIKKCKNKSKRDITETINDQLQRETKTNKDVLSKERNSNNTLHASYLGKREITKDSVINNTLVADLSKPDTNKNLIDEIDKNFDNDSEGTDLSNGNITEKLIRNDSSDIFNEGDTFHDTVNKNNETNKPELLDKNDQHDKTDLKDNPYTTVVMNGVIITNDLIGNELNAKHFHESDDVFEKVRNGSTSMEKDVETTLEINDVINVPEDNEETYNFQEIKYIYLKDMTNRTNSNNFNTKGAKYLVNKEDDIEIISISSDDTTNINASAEIDNSEAAKDQIDTISIESELSMNESDCEYHSSDFEFITEDEAKLDGFIINFDPKRHGTTNECAIEGLSRNMESCADREHRLELDKSYAVPEGDDFLKLFQDTDQALPISEIRFLENKSLRARAPMFVQYEGLGFDMKSVKQVDSSDYREAQETLKKILDIYPENRRIKRRRRY